MLTRRSRQLVAAGTPDRNPERAEPYASASSAGPSRGSVLRLIPTSVGTNHQPSWLRLRRCFAAASTRISRIERAGVGQTQLDVLPERLRHATGTIGPAAVQ